MAITSISRDWGVNPSIVRVTSTDALATITTAGYLTDEADNIAALNNGAFEWQDGDLVAINYSNGEGFFTRDSADNTFAAQPASPGTLANTLLDGRIFVGSALNVATGVALSGDATIINTGALTIANNAVTSAKLAATIRKYATVAITAAEFNGMYAAPKLLLAAQGADTLIVLDQLQLAMTYGAAAYADGGVAAVQYDSTANGAGVIASSTLAAAVFQAAASTTFTMNAGIVALPFATTVNKGLYLSNITGAFTTGDSDFVAHLWYRVIPTV